MSQSAHRLSTSRSPKENKIMKNPYVLAAAAFVVTGLTIVAFPADAQQRQTAPDMSFRPSVGENDCMIDYDTTDKKTAVKFGMGIEDGVFSVDITRSRWEIVDDQDLDREDVPVTLTFDDGRTTSAAYGGFKDGMRQGVWSVWHGRKDDPAASARAFDMMRTTQKIAVAIDGDTIGTVDMAMIGFGYDWMKRCVADERTKRGL